MSDDDQCDRIRNWMKTHTAPAREGYEYFPVETPEQVEAEVKEIMRKYPFMAEGDARRLNVLRALAQCGSRYMDSQGGGQFPDFLNQMRAKYGRRDIH